MTTNDTSPHSRSVDEDLQQVRTMETALQKRTDELAALNQELTVLSYSLSHDLRSPLRAIDAFSEALVEDYEARLDEQGLDYLRRIRDAARQMDVLIRNLVELANVSRAVIRKQPVDVTELVNAIVADLKNREPERRIEIMVQPDMKLVADPVLLRVAFKHLIENALKFTSKHSAAKIEIGNEQRDRKSLFFVRDDGAGFDPAYASRMFGPFQRFHKEGEFHGTGIGLAMVQRIVHRHGGTVWATGQVEQGATFYIALE